MVDEVQGAIDEAKGGRSFEAPWGKRYEVADKVAAMPMVKFAHLQQAGKLNDMDPEVFSVVHDLLWAVMTDESYARFEQDSTDVRATFEELLGCVQPAIAAIAARPTKLPSDSSDGPPPTTESSTGSTPFEETKRRLGLVPVSPEALVG